MYLIATCLFVSVDVRAKGNDALAGPEVQEVNQKTIADQVIQAEKMLFETPDSVIVTLEPILLELTSLPSDSLAARAFYVMGTAYYFKDYYNIAVENYEKALETSYSKTNDAFRSRVLNNLGVSHDLLRHHDDALVYYFEALELERKRGSASDVADVYNNISLVYYAIGDYDEAMQALTQAEELIDGLAVGPINGLILQNRGIIYSALGQDEESMQVTKEAIQIFEAFGYYTNKLQSVLNLAIDLIDRQELSQAKALISEAIKEAVQHDMPVQRAMMNIQLGRIALLEGDPAGALSYLDSSRALFDSMEERYLSFPLHIFELRVEAYASIGNVAKVKRAMEEYIYYAQERDLANRARAVNELKTQLSYNENVAEVQQKTIELERQRTRTSNFIWLSIIIFLLSASLLLGYRYRERKLAKMYDLNQQLRQKKALLKQFSKSELERDQVVISQFKKTDSGLMYSNKRLGSNTRTHVSLAPENENQAEGEGTDEKAVRNTDKADQANIATYNQLQELMEAEKLYLEQGMNLSDLSARMGVSGRILSATIKHFSGTSFNHFINDYRVRLAMEVLEDENQNHLSLDAVYVNCGFSSKTTFYSAFDRVTGMTPSQYRKISQREKYTERSQPNA